jgi:hypothetical protein
MLPADTIAEITTNLVALNLQPKAWSGQSLREVERLECPTLIGQP